MFDTVAVSNDWTGKGFKEKWSPVGCNMPIVHVVHDGKARSEISAKCGNRAVVEALFEKIASRTLPRRRYEAHEQFYRKDGSET
jgi:hypothetical protein